ncbi:HigA family addiction module antitoxin [Terasakiella sp. A23]|uniref:HigA family addiction module antitoxin n=1 Tax=Terasakiella sp. FCG-A23 TaxID=3080561 RepID=UPI0029555513|nr:HigA family addiction module antitoxin [Terasakiella sp. A23]MDV7341817.1 HigA family addiction module antitoxin [Terasakiella sp. A23]
MDEILIDIEHPGVMLKEDFLNDLNIKPGAFAKAIGVDRAAIKNIIDGKRAITADMSLRFGLFFDMSSGFWLNLQNDYDLRISRRDNLSEFIKIVTPYAGLRT